MVCGLIACFMVIITQASQLCLVLFDFVFERTNITARKQVSMDNQTRSIDSLICTGIVSGGFLQVVSWHNVLAFRLAQATAGTCDGNTATSSERFWSRVWG